MKLFYKLCLIWATTGFVACQSSELKPQEALEVLQTNYETRTASTIFKTCPKELQVRRVYKAWNEDNVSHPCDKFGFKAVFAEVFADKYGILKKREWKYKITADTLVMNANQSTDIYTGMDFEKLKKMGAEKYIEETEPSVFKVKHFDYRVNEIVGIRQNEEGGLGENGDCDAIVQFKYELTNKAPWAEDYLNIIKYKEIRDDCFQKFDTGWQVKK